MTFSSTREEQNIQKLISNTVGYGKIFAAVFTVALLLLWGSWSDRNGKRKPIILIPIVGGLLKSLGLLLCVYIKDTPVQVAIAVQVIFPALTGGWSLLMAGIFSYLSEITDESNRTFRIGIASILYHISFPVGASLSGYLTG